MLLKYNFPQKINRYSGANSVGFAIKKLASAISVGAVFSTFMALDCNPANAVYITLSRNSGTSTALLSGQSFVPADGTVGGSPYTSLASQYYLLDMTFTNAGPQLAAAKSSVYLSIYEVNTSNNAISTFIGNSLAASFSDTTNTSTYATTTFSFGLNAPLLNKATRYAAIFRSATNGGGAIVTPRLVYSTSGNTYTNGLAYLSTGNPSNATNLSGGVDLRFSATFTDNPAEVPFDFNPLPGALILGGVYGLKKLRQRSTKKLEKV